MTVVYNGDDVGHVFAPNPKMQGNNWEAEYPPIKTTAKWLVNKYTGEIFPNTEEFSRRSDILEPYLGELPRDGVSEGSTVAAINQALNPATQTVEEMSAL